MYDAIRSVLFHFLAHPDMRVVHISIQQTHLHLIVEATDKAALSRGMKSFATRSARAINAASKRKGKVFKFRYHAKQIRTERYARNAIAYVLNNFRRHGEPIAANCVLDPYSSAVSFTGWKKNRKWTLPSDYEPLPVSPPRTPLLKSNWTQFGLIDPWEIPGPGVF